MAKRSSPIQDKRIQCPYCGMKTWSNDYVSFMRDHDRPDGRRCLQAAHSIESSRNRSGVSHAWPPGAPIGHGFYRVSDKFAGQLARGVGKKLPKHGTELRVELEDGRLAWLQRTPFSPQFHTSAPKRGWVWALHGIQGYS